VPPRPPRQGPPPVGPGTTPADSWETAPPVGDEYQARQRRPRTGPRLIAASWMVASGVVLLLCAAIVLPFLIGGSSSDQSAGTGTATSAGDTPIGSSPASGLPVISSSGITQTSTGSQTAGGPVGGPTSIVPSTPATTTGASQFQPLTLQAVNYGTPYQQPSYCNNVTGVLLGANSGTPPVNSLNFGNFTAPDQATYTVTVYAGESGKGPVPVVITIDGNDQPDWSISGCGQTTTVSLPRSAGPHNVVVTFKGKANQGQNALIQKIVIERL
jgi:hypothetical protein